MLKMNDVTVQYGQNKVLDGFSMTVRDRAMYGLVGHGGAGKSTAVQLMCGLILPDSGTVMIDDMEAGSLVRRRKRRIGYMPDQTGAYPNLTVAEYMDFFASCYFMSGPRLKRRIYTLLEMVGLHDKQDQYVDVLPKGQQKKLSLARALIHDPKVLILDEPFLLLDPHTRFEFRQIVANLADSGKTIVITSHLMEDISDLCTDVGIIDHGRMVVEGSFGDVQEQVDNSSPIVIRLGGNVTGAMHVLRQDSCVQSVSIRNGEILLAFNGDHQQEIRLLKQLVDAEIPVQSFYREEGNLESMFMQLNKDPEERRITSYEAESNLSEG